MNSDVRRNRHEQVNCVTFRYLEAGGKCSKGVGDMADSASFLEFRFSRPQTSSTFVSTLADQERQLPVL